MAYIGFVAILNIALLIFEIATAFASAYVPFAIAVWMNVLWSNSFEKLMNL